MKRDEAEAQYVKAIITRGNPEYFIWKAVREWTNEDLADHMSEIGFDVDEVEDEE